MFRHREKKKGERKKRKEPAAPPLFGAVSAFCPGKGGKKWHERRPFPCSLGKKRGGGKGRGGARDACRLRTMIEPRKEGGRGKGGEKRA